MASCAAVGCLNNTRKKDLIVKDGKKISFFKFPLHDKKVLQEWLIKIKRNDCGEPFVPNEYSKMFLTHVSCSMFG